MSAPNILVFFTDQQRWDSTGVHGNPLGLTPNFDYYSRTGTLLANTFTCQPVCGPARSCMQTGYYATQTGCYRNGIPLGTKLPSLAERFNAAGYDTGYIGKWHLGSTRGAVPKAERSGYDYWLAANALEFVSDAYQTRLYDGDDQPVDLPGYRADALADAAIRYVSEARKNPFFLFLSFLEPHHQNHRDDYPAPRGYAEQYTGRWTPPDLAALGGTSPQHLPGYWGMVKRLDEAFGRVMDALVSQGKLDNTVILFTSDHGCHFKTRNGEYKRSCHDSSLRVPGLIHGPGFEGGRRFEGLVSLVDFPATLLDAAGISQTESLPGRSILPRLATPSLGNDEEVIISQISEAQHGRTIRTRRWKYAISAPWSDAPRPAEYTESHLYDLVADPYELTNLIEHESFAAVAGQLRERLQRELRRIDEPDVPIHLVDRSSRSQRSVELPGHPASTR